VDRMRPADWFQVARQSSLNPSNICLKSELTDKSRFNIIRQLNIQSIKHWQTDGQTNNWKACQTYTPSNKQSVNQTSKTAKQLNR